MREIIRKERKLYSVLHFCAFCYGVCVAIMCVVLGLIVSVEVFDVMQDFYRQAESVQSGVAGFMLAGIVCVGLAMVYGYVGRLWFRTFFSSFEHKCAMVYERYNHWPLCVGFWISFVVTVSVIVCVCVLVIRKLLFLPIESAEQLHLILVIPFIGAALCVLIISFVTYATKKALHGCYKRLGYDI